MADLSRIAAKATEEGLEEETIGRSIFKIDLVGILEEGGELKIISSRQELLVRENKTKPKWALQG